MTECRVCGGPHRERLHDAVLRVRQHLRQRMEYILLPPPVATKRKLSTHLNQITITGTGRP